MLHLGGRVLPTVARDCTCLRPQEARLGQEDLADLKDQLDNLRLLLDSVEGALSQKREQAEIANSTEAWLHALRGRVADVEDGTKEPFRARRQLVRLLVAEITVSTKPENSETEVRITYRFGPPPASGSAGSPSQGGVFGDDVKNGRGSITPGINTPTLTVVAVR
jgi:hypothetical protein